MSSTQELPSAEVSEVPFEQDMMLYEAYSSDESMVEAGPSDASDPNSTSDSDSASDSDSTSDSDSASDSDSTSDPDSSSDGSGDESTDDALAASIDPSEVSYEVPEPIEESSLLDDVPEASVHMVEETTYELVQKSSQRQKDKLIDSDGYTYNLHKKRGTTAYWQCTVRNKTVNCNFVRPLSFRKVMSSRQACIHTSTVDCQGQPWFIKSGRR